MVILDFQQSCSSAVARAFTQSGFLCSSPCPVGRFPALPPLAPRLSQPSWGLWPRCRAGLCLGAVLCPGWEHSPAQSSLQDPGQGRAPAAPTAAGLLKATRACSAISICENVQIPKLNPGLSSLFFT